MMNGGNGVGNGSASSSSSGGGHIAAWTTPEDVLSLEGAGMPDPSTWLLLPFLPVPYTPLQSTLPSSSPAPPPPNHSHQSLAVSSPSHHHLPVHPQGLSFSHMQSAFAFDHQYVTTTASPAVRLASSALSPNHHSSHTVPHQPIYSLGHPLPGNVAPGSLFQHSPQPQQTVSFGNLAQRAFAAGDGLAAVPSTSSVSSTPLDGRPLHSGLPPPQMQPSLVSQPQHPSRRHNGRALNTSPRAAVTPRAVAARTNTSVTPRSSPLGALRPSHSLPTSPASTPSPVAMVAHHSPLLDTQWQSASSSSLLYNTSPNTLAMEQSFQDQMEVDFLALLASADPSGTLDLSSQMQMTSASRSMDTSFPRSDVADTSASSIEPFPQNGAHLFSSVQPAQSPDGWSPVSSKSPFFTEPHITTSPSESVVQPNTPATAGNELPSPSQNPLKRKIALNVPASSDASPSSQVPLNTPQLSIHSSPSVFRSSLPASSSTSPAVGPVPLKSPGSMSLPTAAMADVSPPAQRSGPVRILPRIAVAPQRLGSGSSSDSSARPVPSPTGRKPAPPRPASKTRRSSRSSVPASPAAGTPTTLTAGITSSPAALRPHDVLMPPPAVPSPRLKGKSPRMPATVASSPSLAPTDGSPLPALSLDRCTAHRVSDQRRRDELRICFEALVQVLPPSSTTLTGSISSSQSSSSTAFEDDDEDVDDDPGGQAGAGAGMGKGTAGSKALSRGPNRVSILSRTVDYIQTLKTRTSALDERMEQLRAELEALKAGEASEAMDTEEDNHTPKAEESA